MFELPFPESGTTEVTTFETEGPVVVVGANGSGKTRIGARIEQMLVIADKPRLRISAQKSLVMPEMVALVSPESAFYSWLYGQHFGVHIEKGNTDADYRKRAGMHGRWGDNPATATLADYSVLVQFLLADYATNVIRHHECVEKAREFIPIPETRLHRVKRIWEEILPGRTLVISTGKIETLPVGGSIYSSSEMSDGERVIFYLAASCICAEDGAILLIDEPELHLHRSIQSRMWDLLERERSDCLFVYLTHDLEFAASRAAAFTIALLGFDGEKWQWIEVPRETGIPEEVLFNILGSRRPILFAEGDGSSLDVEIYSQVYPNRLVVSISSCEHVIHATASFSRLQHLHSIDSKGLVDLDQRTADDVASLARVGVFTTGVSEAENLLLIEPVLRAMVTLRHQDDPDEIVEKVKAHIFQRMERDRERITTSMVKAFFNDRLTKIARLGNTEDEIATELHRVAGEVDAIAREFRNRVKTIIDTKDYPAALAIYPNKGLPSEISVYFGLRNYKDEVLRLLKMEAGLPVLDALRLALPAL